MYTLGIETSCDDTSVAIVKNSTIVLSNVISSSIKFHKKYGGVIPEIASRLHLEVISCTLEEALKQAKIRLKDISLIAVTKHPGLKGSLLVGTSFARALAFGLSLPLVEVNHLHAHIYAPFLNSLWRRNSIFPFVGMVVSGGHTSLFYLKDFNNIECLGATLDDACGEAFDKVAKILGLGYPGGPIIEKLAKNGDLKKIKFGKIKTKQPLDFSFSGIKTGVLYYLISKGYKKSDALSTKHYPISLKRNLSASFQETAVDSLVNKAILACKMKGVKLLAVGGGVAANGRLRQRFQQETKREGLELKVSPLEFCTDNAGMVAGLGQYLFKRGLKA